ncbi:MAG: outer membrane protein assembly factor BamA [Pseudomonadota bacterium]|nr:outer membrane protein assembly factor BamA [Pseudomonadota bacterium]
MIQLRLLKVAWAAFLLLVWAPVLSAFETFVVGDIRVQGLERLESGRVFAYVDVGIGEPLDTVRAQKLIHSLYRSGYFSDVELLRDGETLIIRVVERPTIASFSIEGNDEIPTEQLMTGLRQAGLAEGRVFDRSLLDQVERELRRQYFANGRYGVDIATEIEDVVDNRVSLSITIDEGEVATIRRINIVGNNAFDDDELLDILNLRKASVWTIFGSRDRYSQQALGGDLETLTSYYQDRGYLNFRIDSTQVSLSPDKQDIFITVNVDEGDQYRVSGVELVGDLVVPETELWPLVLVEPAGVFSRKDATESAKRIGDRLGDEGYAFADVEAVPEIDQENKAVKVNLVVRPGSRYYVRNINFQGNFATDDEALRREMRQFEGGYFSTSDVRRSRIRLARLPFVENVDVKTVPVPGSDDLVDINYDITERSAGAFQLGVGYSSGQGLLFNANVSHSNWFGTGNRVSIDFVKSDFSDNYRASLTEPYYTIDGVSRTISAFYRSTDALTNVSSRFTSDAWGGTLRYGIPVSEYDSIRLGGSYRSTQLKTNGDITPQYIRDFVRDNGEEFDTLLFETGWIRDTRNRTVFADTGYIHRLFADVGVPGLDLTYYKLNYQFQQYFSFTDKLVAAFNLDVGYGDSYDGTTDLPPYEKFFAGGISSVRGYRGASLGPRDEFGNPTGGNFKTVTQLELLLPTAFTDSRNTRLVLFVDAGNTFDGYGSFEASELRASAGIGFQWLTPILGLLEFALAYPLNDEPDDDTETFSFTFGSTF